MAGIGALGPLRAGRAHDWLEVPTVRAAGNQLVEPGMDDVSRLGQ